MVELVVGFWFQIVNNTYNDNIYKLEITQASEIKEVINKLADARLLTKSNIKQLMETLKPKVSLVFKYHKEIYKNI